jgi:hypothetical protein
MVYKVAGIASVKAMNELLLEDWRVDRDGLIGLDRDFIQWIAPRYRRKSVIALSAWFKKEAL